MEFKYLPSSLNVHPNTTRLDINLKETDDSSYNAVNYVQLLNLDLGKDRPNLDLLGLTNEDTFDRFEDYEEESYIDNTEVYRDTFPAGKEPELGGFYINSGKLKLKSNFAESNSVDKIKKEKKKNSRITKAIRTKDVRRKEKKKKPQFKNPKSENTKINESHMMHSNIRLDALLKTIRKQKENGIVKNIKMPNASNNKSGTSGIKIVKEICKISSKQKAATSGSKASKKTCKISSKHKSDKSGSRVKATCNINPKKKNSSMKKCSKETSITTVVLNSTEVTIPKEDFLSSKTISCYDLSSSSSSVDVQLLKKILHTVHKNEKEPSCAKNNLTLKTINTSKSERLPATKISTESISVKNSLPSNMAISSSSCRTNYLKKLLLGTSKDDDTVLPSHMSSATDLKELSHLNTDSTLTDSSSMNTKRTSSNFVSTAVPKNVLHSSSKVPDLITITPVLKTINPLSSLTTSIAKNIINPTSKVTTDSTVTASSSMLNTMIKPKSLKANVLTEVPHSSQKVTSHSTFAGSGSTVDTVVKSRPLKANVVIEVPQSSRKVISDSTFVSKNPMPNITAHSSFHKAAVPKEVLYSSRKITTESYNLQDTTLTNRTKPKETIPANFKESCLPKTSVKPMCPKTISKYMLKVIHDKNVDNTPESSSSRLPMNAQNDIFDYGRSFQSVKYRPHNYSKTSVPGLQLGNNYPLPPVLRFHSITNSSVVVSQPKQSGLMNSTESSSNTTAVNMYKMNISPIVRHKEPESKF